MGIRGKLAAYFQKNFRLLWRKLNKVKGKFYPLDELSIGIGIPCILLEQWQRDGEPSIGEAKKIAEFFSRALNHELYDYQIIMKDLSVDPFFNDVLF